MWQASRAWWPDRRTLGVLLALTVAAAFGLWPVALVLLGATVALWASATRWTPSMTLNESDERGLIPRLWRELSRSRRHEHPFAVVRLTRRTSEKDNKNADEVDPVDHFETVSERARRTDEIWLKESDLYVLLPVTSHKKASLALQRMRAQAPALHQLSARIAAFPDDALTLGALLIKLRAPASVVGEAERSEGSGLGDATSLRRIIQQGLHVQPRDKVV